MANTEELDQTPADAVLLSLFGSVNHAWALLDLVSSAAFGALLKIDPSELGIIIGRLETQAKINKMHLIARHRRNKKIADALAPFKKDLADLRPMRNAIIHGVYIGKTKNDELCFRLAAEFIVDDGEETAHELFVVTPSDLAGHIAEVLRITATLINLFEIDAMRKLLDLRARTRRKGATK